MAWSIPLRAVVISVVIHSLWGANPVAVKLGLVAVPPLWSGFVRFALGIACVATWALIRGDRLWPTRQEWPALGFIGVLFTAQIAVMNIGYGMTGGAMGAILIATNPLFAVVFTHYLVEGDRLYPLKVLGLTVAFAGTVVVLAAGRSPGDFDLADWGNLVVLASACMLGFRLSVSARVLRDIDPVRVALWQMMISLPLFAAGGLAFETIAWERLGWLPVLGLAFQGVVIAGVGFVTAFWLMQRYTPSVMMSFNFVSPVAGVLVAAWILDESVSAMIIAGMVLVAAGLALIARRPPGASG